MRLCENCNKPLGKYQRSDARFCTTRCRVAANRKPKFPERLEKAARWVCWAPVERNGKITKRPITPSGAAASSTNPETWSKYSAVKNFPRIGWVLGAGIGCIDLDHCLEGGKLADWAREVLDEHAQDALLVEVSPSGTGIHIFIEMNEGKGRVIRDGRNIEIYPPESGRFICMTGKKFKR